MSWKIMDASNLGWGGVIEDGWRKGPWTAEEDRLLIDYVGLHGEGRWNSVARLTGLKRNGKSCRLRWVNYLRPDLKRGQITPHEENIIIELHARWGNRWSTIARSLPGRTDNEIKNYWRTHFKQKLKPSKDKATNRLLKRQQFREQQEQQKQHQQLQSPHQQLLQLNQFDIKKIMALLEVDNNETKVPYCYVPQLTDCNNMYPNATEDQGMVYNMFGVSASMTVVPETTSTDEIAWDGLWNLDDYGLGSFGVAKFPPYKASLRNLVAPFC